MKKKINLNWIITASFCVVVIIIFFSMKYYVKCKDCVEPPKETPLVEEIIYEKNPIIEKLL